MTHRISLLTLGLLFLALSHPASAQSAPPAGFVTIQGDQFFYKGLVWKLKGTNYYPRQHMWADMWSSWDWPAIQSEVQLIRGLGMNCVRILVPYSNGGWGGKTVPASRLQMLEDLVNEFGNNGIRSCVTLFDWETSFPAAGTTRESEHKAHLSAIVNRLKNNPYVLMWDVKNEPDHPANLGTWMDNWDPSPNKAKIVSWLQRMCNAVRAIDPNHPVSAGLRWWENVNDVIHFEDVAIFHSYWPNINEQIDTVKGYMGANQKPILCEEYGWPSHPTPCNRDGQVIYDYNEQAQLNVYINHLTAFTQKNIAGGMQWMTFDSKGYSSNPDDSFENFFGLWYYSLSPKPAGIYYRDNFPVNRFDKDGDFQAPAPVTSLIVRPGNSRVELTWTNPADGDFTGTMIRYSTTAPPAGPTDGALLSTQPGTSNTIQSFTHQGAENTVTYYYSLFAHDGRPNYAAPASASGIPAIPGDFDHDNDVDMSDFGHFQSCISGSSGIHVNPGCDDAKFDDDADVDSDDLAVFRRCFSGSGVAAQPSCAP